MAIQLVLHPYRLSFHRPFVTAFGTLAERQGILLGACGTEASAATGWGEAAPLPGFGGESLARSDAVLRCLAAEAQAWSALLTPQAIRALMADLERRFPDAPCARAAVDQALSDRAARLAGLPLWRWLRQGWGLSDDSPQPRVAVNATVGADEPSAAAAQAAVAAAAGYQAIKVKLGGEPRRDLACMAAVRAAVGPGVALRADANGAWDEALAARMLTSLAPMHLEYVEQPLPAGSGPAAQRACLLGMARLRRLGVPLAADESLLVPGALPALLDAGAADLLILKPQLLGGLHAAARLAAAGRAAGLDSVVTTALDAAIGRMGAVQLAAALGLRRPCGLATGTLLAEDLTRGPVEEAGFILLPPTPGLGLAPD